MSGQSRPNNATELLKSMMRQLQIEIDLGNQKGKDTPEGLNHLARAQNIKSQLIRFQQQMHRQQSMQQAQQQAQQQQNQQNQQNTSQPTSSQSPNSMGMISNSGSPANNQSLNNGQNMANNGMNTGNATTAQQQAQQIRMAQFAQLNQLKQQQQLRAQGMSPQSGATQGGVNQNLGNHQQQQQQQQMNQPSLMNQPVSGQQTINMNSANGLQQRFADIDTVRRVYVQLGTRLEQIQTALQFKTDPVEVKRLQGQITYYRNQQATAKQKEIMMMRELRLIIDQQQQSQQSQNTQSQQQPQQPQQQQQPQSQQQQQQPSRPSSRAPQGQQTAAVMQSQMLRGLPRNQNGQPMTQAQINAARQAQLRSLQGMNNSAGTPAAASNPAGSSGSAQGFNGSAGAASAVSTAGSDTGNTGNTGVAGAGASAKAKVAGAAEPVKSGAVVPSPNRYLAQSLPIPAHLNVQLPQALAVRPGRPTLTNGGATDAQALNSPALVRPPTMDLSGDRALSKRKLSDLVTSVMGDENEPLIDGDVEELLLDLADEFVSSVTSFACKLAKHRKSDVLEAKDIHMHLERNWNMHIAGYSSDEIRSIRRFLPTQTYQQKLQGISMAKTMNK